MNKKSHQFIAIQTKLRKAINNSTLSLGEISERTNISLSTLKGYMIKNRLPNLKRFYAICVVLNLSPDDILNLK